MLVRVRCDPAAQSWVASANPARQVFHVKHPRGAESHRLVHSHERTSRPRPAMTGKPRCRGDDRSQPKLANMPYAPTHSGEGISRLRTPVFHVKHPKGGADPHRLDHSTSAEPTMTRDDCEGAEGDDRGSVGHCSRTCRTCHAHSGAGSADSGRRVFHVKHPRGRRPAPSRSRTLTGPNGPAVAGEPGARRRRHSQPFLVRSRRAVSGPKDAKCFT